MTKEEKTLLIQDLCARLPYGVKGLTLGSKTCTLIMIMSDGVFKADTFVGHITSGQFKPYLRPMSSMTEEEMGNLEKCLGKKYDFRFTETESFIYIDWLLAHHFDYRGLIEKGLALEAPDGMYKLNQ